MVIGRWRVVVFGVCLWGITGCGDGDPREIDGSPGTLVDAAGPGVDAAWLDAAVGGDGGAIDAGAFDGGVAPDASLPDAAVADGGSDAGPSGPSIEVVTTDDGDREVRQGSTVSIVVAGSGLGEVDGVAVGELAATVISAAADEVRAELVVPHGTAPGAREVTVSGPGGTASLADGLTITVYVVAADALPGGRGTFESPLLFCDAETVTALEGDTISLLAGEHVCDGFEPISIAPGVALEGAGPDATLVRGAAASFPGLQLGLSGDPSDSPVSVRGFSIVAPEPAAQGAIVVRAGRSASVAVEDLRVEGPGILLLGSFTAAFTRVDVDCGGAYGFGLTEEGSATVTVTDSRFAACGVGLAVAGGSWSVSGSTFERSAIGISSDPSYNGDYSYFTVSDCELDDNTTGMQVTRSFVDLVDTVVRDNEVTPEAMQTGIRVGSGGALEITGGEIVGHDGVGITAFASVEGSAFSVTLRDALVVGGTMGIDVAGHDNVNALILRDSVVRDQTYASVRIEVDEWYETILDLGNGGGTGGNQLSVVSGIALRDIRTDPYEFDRVIDAAGITLNGRSYDGQLVEGPTSAPPDYEIVADGQIQF